MIRFGSGYYRELPTLTSHKKSLIGYPTFHNKGPTHYKKTMPKYLTTILCFPFHLHKALLPIPSIPNSPKMITINRPAVRAPTAIFFSRLLGRHIQVMWRKKGPYVHPEDNFQNLDHSSQTLHENPFMYHSRYWFEHVLEFHEFSLFSNVYVPDPDCMTFGIIQILGEGGFFHHFVYRSFWLPHDHVHTGFPHPRTKPVEYMFITHPSSLEGIFFVSNGPAGQEHLRASYSCLRWHILFFFFLSNHCIVPGIWYEVTGIVAVKLALQTETNYLHFLDRLSLANPNPATLTPLENPPILSTLFHHPFPFVSISSLPLSP